MKKILYTAISFAPMLALGQTGTGTVSGLGSLVTAIRALLNSLIPILIALAVIYFFWGLITFIRASGDEKKRAEGKGQMLWGIIAIAVMVSIFGIIAWLQSTLGVQTGSVILPPTI